MYSSVRDNKDAPPVFWRKRKRRLWFVIFNMNIEEKVAKYKAFLGAASFLLLAFVARIPPGQEIRLWASFGC